jgi:hypothetical protein
MESYSTGGVTTARDRSHSRRQKKRDAVRDMSRDRQVARSPLVLSCKALLTARGLLLDGRSEHKAWAEGNGNVERRVCESDIG